MQGVAVVCHAVSVGDILAEPVTMDTRPSCGAVLSDSVDTGYELGIRTGAIIWRLAC